MSTPESSNTASPTAPAGAAASGSVDWEGRYQAGDTPWEKATPAPPLLEWLAQNELHGRVLVPGCGSGHDVRALAAAGAAPIGIDLAPSAIDRANSFPRTGSERYRLENLFALPPELLGQFDWVFEHTCFCAIEPARRADYVAAVHAALAPGGLLLAIFYLNPDHPDGPPFGSSREELDRLFSPYFERVDDIVPTAAYPGREGRELVQVLTRREQATRPGSPRAGADSRT